jgi:hypothetical protein
MKMKKLLAPVLLATLVPIFVSSCKASLCERKDRWLETHCTSGATDVTWSPDPNCAAKTETCNQAQLRQFEGYVECLEASRECSLEVMNACASQFPGGVNLFCS